MTRWGSLGGMISGGLLLGGTIGGGLLLLAVPNCQDYREIDAGTSTGGGGGGSSSSSSGPCFDYTSFKADTTVTFQGNVLPIFQRSCTFSATCHGLQTPVNPAQHFLGPPMGTMPTPAQIDEIFAQSVGVASVANPDMKVIDPGKPETSFIMYKLDNELE